LNRQDAKKVAKSAKTMRKGDRTAENAEDAEVNEH